MSEPSFYIVGKYKFVTVRRSLIKDKVSGLNLYFIINNRSGDLLGRIVWYPPWRMWIAHFLDDVVWSSGCLADIQDAIGKITKMEAAP